MLAALLAAYTADHDWRTLVRKCKKKKVTVHFLFERCISSSVSQWIVGGGKDLKCEEIYRMSKKEKC